MGSNGGGFKALASNLSEADVFASSVRKTTEKDFGAGG